MDKERRDILKIIGATAIGLSVNTVAGAGEMSNKMNSGGKKYSAIDGSVPMISELEKVMSPSMTILNQLMQSYSLMAKTLTTQKAYWLGFSSWAADKLSERLYDENIDLTTLGSFAWGVHTTGYWGGVELRKNWGAPSFGNLKGMAPPFEEVQRKMAENFNARAESIRGGGEYCLDLLSKLMREVDTRTAILYTTAYNAGLQVIKTENPPLGRKRPHRPSKPGIVRVNRRHFMRVDYELTTPLYLRKLRSAYEVAVIENPDSFLNTLIGNTGQEDLRDVWKRGVDHGYSTWGGNDSQDHWSQDYFDESVHWTLVLSFGLEAASLAAMIALVTQNEKMAIKAIMANILFLGATPGWMLGLLDDKGKYPQTTST